MTPRHITGVVLGVLAGCHAFPSIDLGLCGNGIIEQDEDCDDGNDDDDDACSQCHLVCAPSADATDACPPGRVCAPDRLCRGAAGGFATEAIRFATEGVLAIGVGDLDGDARDDLAALQPSGIDALHGAPEQTVHLTGAEGWFVLGDLDGDGRDELTLARAPDLDHGGGLSILHEIPRDDDGRVVAPVIAATVLAQGDTGRLLSVAPVHDSVLDLVSAQESFAWRNGQLSAAPLATAVPIDPTALVGPIAGLPLGDGVQCSTADGVAFARRSFALAARGTEAVTMLATCDGAELTRLADVALPDGEHLGAAGSFLVDVDADDTLDLVVQTESAAVRVAYGVGDGSFHGDAMAPEADGDDRFAATPLWQPEATTTVLLAAADFDDDGRIELVTSTDFVDAPEACVQGCPIAWDAPLGRAAAIDFDGDGELDVVGTRVGSDGLDDTLAVRLGDRSLAGRWFTEPHLFELEGTAIDLVDGDFDGDTLADVAAVVRRDDDDDGPAADAVVVVHGGGTLAWRSTELGPFDEVQSIAVDARDTLVLRTRDAQGRAVGTFLRPADPVADFGVSIRQPAMVRTATGVAVVALGRDGQGERLFHFAADDGTLSPRDLVEGPTPSGMGAGAGQTALSIAVELDGLAPEELVLLATTDAGGAVWTLAQTDAGVWEERARLDVGPGFATRPVAGDAAEPGATPVAGPGSSVLPIDVDVDGDLDLLVTTAEVLPRVIVLRNDDGWLGAPTVLFDSVHFGAFEIGDLAPWHPRADGTPRFVVGGDDGVGIATVDLDRGRIVIDDRSEARAEAVDTADFDGDGLLDLVIATSNEVRVHAALETLGLD